MYRRKSSLDVSRDRSTEARHRPDLTRPICAPLCSPSCSHQLGGRDFQCVRNLDDVYQAKIALSSFNTADICTVEATFVSQMLLRQARGDSAGPQPRPKTFRILDSFPSRRTMSSIPFTPVLIMVDGGFSRMGRGKHKFRQTDMTRAIKAAQAAGMEIGHVEVTPDGNIRIFALGGNDPELAAALDQWHKEYREKQRDKADLQKWLLEHSS